MGSKLNHSKYKNTGIIFEFLVRKITSDILSDKPSKAYDILKKYFVKTELSKEYKIYENLIKKQNLSETKAVLIIDTLLKLNRKLNNKKLNEERFNLIKEIKANYDIDELFKTQIPNYKIYASFYVLREIYNSNKFNPKDEIHYKTTLLEYLTSSNIKEKTTSPIIKEFLGFDKDTRLLAYNILLENFNKKYKGLNLNQKRILKEYITCLDSNVKMRSFYNEEVKNIKKIINELNEKTIDKPTKLKIKGIINLIHEIKAPTKITEKNLSNLLYYHNLIDELEKTNV